MEVLVAPPSLFLQESQIPKKPSYGLPPSPVTSIHEGTSTSVDGDVELLGLVSLPEEQGAKHPRVYPLPPLARSNKVLEVDLKTPDKHVPRDPRLIRLTGVHPFNVEAPLSDLYDEGFLTTKDLHYVRNHGAVPEVHDHSIFDWEFSIEGMVEYPVKMTLADLIAEYEVYTYPVTLVCAGNRRKEQNVVRKTKGFSWGAAGLSTALWTGVPLSDLLARAIPKRRAKYVCFEGADKLPNGYYGTSIKLSWAMDPERGVLVAHRMNGEPLHPDHGKPLRIVIPGQIGGRSVKWLTRIIVTDKPSDNWYHIYDNRVLPTTVTPEASADLPDTWKDERYAIYDLNTNSAICYPAHDEKVSLTDENRNYAVRGYAYAGGGRRISRVELTLDKGKSWILANIRYPEDDYRLAPEGDTLYGGKVDMAWRESCFCWCFWEAEIPLPQLRDCADIMVRAMDDSMMVQPRDMYWSVLGMMNNPWYRVVVHRDGHGIRFEHPTQPALMPGGWMERIKSAGGNLINGSWGESTGNVAEAVVAEEPAKQIKMTRDDVRRIITLEELRAHNNDNEPWFVIEGEVYDGTAFLEQHPGGAASIVGAAGQDVTEEFLAIHSENAKLMMPEYHLGTLDTSSKQQLLSGEDTGMVEDVKQRPVFLHQRHWTKGILREKRKVSADTKIFVFDLGHADQKIGLPVGQHLMMRLRDPATRDAIIRAYTPISNITDVGKLEVLVKIYYDMADKKGGKMTQALDSIPIGHFVDFKGPVGKFEYIGQGLCSISGRERRVRRFFMICGGSGITPIFQVLRAVLTDMDDSTLCTVLNGNRTEEDILCRVELESLTTANPKRCRMIHSLTKPGPSWTGNKGRMDKAFYEKEIGRPQEDQKDLVLICGPETMEDSARSILTNDLGWSEDDLLFF